VQLVDATLPVFGAQMLTDTVAASVATRRFSQHGQRAHARNRHPARTRRGAQNRHPV